MNRNSNPIKRKKKRSFMQTVKKKFKNGHLDSHGSYLDQDTHDYFLRVLQQSRQDFENDEEKRIFVKNVFAETIGHEVDYSKNQLVSRILEDLLSLAGDDTLERFTTAFGDDLRAISGHSFASHVLEKLVCVCTYRVHEIARNASSDGCLPNYHTSASFAFVIKVSKFLTNNLDDFVFENYANHVLRATISCLANILPAKQREKGKNSKFSFEINPKEKKLNLEKMNKESEFNPPEFVEILEDLANRILNSPSFVDFPRDTLMSALLQTILLSLYAVKKKGVMKEICKKLVETTYIGDPTSNQLSDAFESQPPVRLFETVMDVSNKKRFRKIYEQCLVGRIEMLAKGRSSCFTFGKLVQRCDDEDKFLEIYAEIREGDTLREIATSPSCILLGTIAHACRRFNAMQEAFVKDISKALDITSSIALVPTLLNLDAKFATSVFDKKPTVSFAGCVILQELLRFKNRSKVVKGLLAMENEELIKLLSDPKGSHIADAFFSSDCCTDKDLDMIIDKFQGSIPMLCASKHGSYALTALWKICPLSLKLKVIEELANTPITNTSGKVIASQIGLELYLSNRKLWSDAQKNLEKARKEFDEL